MVGHQTVYFAYGSNLHLGQMSDRCPESRYLGHAILHDFRWQINTRGVANILSSRDDFVEGLCYLLSKKDEKRLDINEGVRSGAYSKELIPVVISRTSPLIAGRRCSEVREHIYTSAYKSVDSSETEKVEALIYINRGVTNDGPPRDEYVSRINNGIQDAMKLGLSTRFVQTYIRRYIEEPGFGSKQFKLQSPRAPPATHLNQTSNERNSNPQDSGNFDPILVDVHYKYINGQGDVVQVEEESGEGLQTVGNHVRESSSMNRSGVPNAVTSEKEMGVVIGRSTESIEKLGGTGGPVTKLKRQEL